MHRHGYKGRKFGRENDQRRALIKGLATELIEHESIRTTTPKAKELVPYVEKLITKAKKGDLHNRRQIISAVNTVDIAHKLVDEIAPKLNNRSSGHLRIKKDGWRRGDNAEMSEVSFVDELTTPVTSDDKTASKAKDDKAAEAEAKEEAKTAATKKVQKVQPAPKAAKVVAKRTGRRGNR